MGLNGAVLTVLTLIIRVVSVKLSTQCCLLCSSFHSLSSNLTTSRSTHAVTDPPFVFCSGKCYKQVVLTPMLEKRSHESVLDSLPHTVTLISMPSAANGKRGLSVSVVRDVNGSASVQVKE